MERTVRNLVGPILRRIRVDKELSQADLAAKCQTMGWDISRDIVAAIEDQSRAVTETEIVLLAMILKIEAKELLPTKKEVISASARLRPDDDKKEPKKRRRWFGL